MNCAVIGCSDHGQKFPTLILHAKGHREDEYTPAKVKFPRAFCLKHSKLDAYDILSEEDWLKITLEFYRDKRIAPDRTRVDIEWQDITDESQVVESYLS